MQTNLFDEDPAQFSHSTMIQSVDIFCNIRLQLSIYRMCNGEMRDGNSNGSETVQWIFLVKQLDG